MSPTPTLPRVTDPAPSSRLLLRRLIADHVQGQLHRLALAFSCMLLVAGSTASQAWLMEPVLDRVFLSHDRVMLFLIPAAIVGVGIVKAVASYAQDVLMVGVGQRIVAEIQSRLYAHLVRADLALFATRGTGSLISHLTFDANQLRMAVSFGVTGMLKDGLTVVFLAGLMFWQDWRLALMAAVGFPLALWPMMRLGRRARAIMRATQDGMAEITDRLEQTFHGVRQVKAYGREAAEAARTQGLIDRLLQLQLDATRVRSMGSPMVEAIAGTAIAGVVLYGGWRVMQGSTTPGAFFSFIAALLMAYQPIKSLTRLNTQLQEGLAGAERIYAILDRLPEVRDLPSAEPLAIRGGAVRFEGVRFAYGGEVPAVDGITLDVPAGRTVALVGRSGSGKSTLCNLLLRFWDVDGGRILIDGQDIRHVTLESLRGASALVSQDVNLFDDTVRNNILFGRADARDIEVEAAARDAAAHDFIMALPQGYDTPIGPHGVRLSGGERQRLSIARAMLKSAPILLLDEATSALDTAAERQIQAALERLMRGRTTLVVAHRLSTVLHADKIAVLDHGRIIEAGSHRALLAQNGAYARLYRMQFADSEVPAESPA